MCVSKIPSLGAQRTTFFGLLYLPWIKCQIIKNIIIKIFHNVATLLNVPILAICGLHL
jgi:hypothetical protein